MKQLKPTPNEHHWPRNEVKSVECRKRDLVIRIADWSKDKDEPAFDVECYIGGIYDFNESQTFSFHHQGGDKAAAKRFAVEYAQAQIAKLL